MGLQKFFMGKNKLKYINFILNQNGLDSLLLSTQI